MNPYSTRITFSAKAFQMLGVLFLGYILPSLSFTNLVLPSTMSMNSYHRHADKSTTTFPNWNKAPYALSWDKCHDRKCFSMDPLYSSSGDNDNVDDTSSINETIQQKLMQLLDKSEEGEGISLDSLMEMDICIFTRKSPTNQILELGAVQEDGTLAPLSTWTLESIYSTSDTLEFLVDENDRTSPGHGGGLPSNQIWKIWSVLDESDIGYGSRQVGGGKGLGNPHGEESELLYYVERDSMRIFLDEFGEEKIEVKVDAVVKPELEITW